jgi:hypothetical protein
MMIVWLGRQFRVGIAVNRNLKCSVFSVQCSGGIISWEKDFCEKEMPEWNDNVLHNWVITL